MFTAPIRKVLFVNIELGSGCPTAAGPSQLVSLTPEWMIQKILARIRERCEVTTQYIAPPDRPILFSMINSHMTPGTFVLSPDNAVSLAITNAFAGRGDEVTGDIVCDQHIDIYSHRTHGSMLSKANVYRLALNYRQLRHIVFVGARELEEAFFNPYMLLPRLFRHPLDFIYALLRYWQNQHGGFDDRRITLFPASFTRNFAEGVCEAILRLENERELWLGYTGRKMHSFGFEIDMDAFDSQKIHGVDYGLDLPDRLRKEALTKFRNAPLSKKVSAAWHLLYELWVASYIQHKIECPGLAVPNQEEIARAVRRIASSPLPCRFVHITEFKPGFDDPERKTTHLVENLVAEFVSTSRQT